MTPSIALILAAAATQFGVQEAPRQPVVQVTVQATVEIVRAETSAPEPGEGGARRQVRRRGGGQVAVEFE